MRQAGIRAAGLPPVASGDIVDGAVDLTHVHRHDRFLDFAGQVKLVDNGVLSFCKRSG